MAHCYCISLPSCPRWSGGVAAGAGRRGLACATLQPQAPNTFASRAWLLGAAGSQPRAAAACGCGCARRCCRRHEPAWARFGGGSGARGAHAMRLQVLRSLWGVVRADGGALGVGEALERAAAGGAAGVECSLALAHQVGAKDFRDALRANCLSWVPITFSSGPLGTQEIFLEGSPRASHWSSLAVHRDALASNVASALDLASSGGIHVPHVNVHLGHDSMTHDEGVELLGASCDLSERAGVAFAHETHRGRLTYSPWRTPLLLRDEPRARLLADFAHWVVVAEAEPGDRLLEAGVKVRGLRARACARDVRVCACASRAAREVRPSAWKRAPTRSTSRGLQRPAVDPFTALLCSSFSLGRAMLRCQH